MSLLRCSAFQFVCLRNGFGTLLARARDGRSTFCRDVELLFEESHSSSDNDNAFDDTYVTLGLSTLFSFH